MAKKKKINIDVSNKNITNADKIKFINTHPEMTYAEIAPHIGYTSPESVRSFVKRMNMSNKRNNVQSKRNDIPLSEQVLILIKNKKMSLYELSNTLNVAPKMVEAAISDLKATNRMVDEYEDGFEMAKSIIPTREYLKIPMLPEKEIGFGFVADTHLGSKYERLDVLNALYDRFSDYGISTVYHGGNWIDGEARFNKYDIYVHGVEAQVNNFIENYPQRKGIKTQIISGDDHEGWYVQREHINIGQYMENMARNAGRNDLIDLGYMERDIELKQKNGSAILRVIHAGGGSAYALSYSTQKYAESLQGGEKPKIILVGHYHKFDYNYAREIHIIQGGCTCDQTPFMRKRKLQAMVGGCVIWIRQANNGVITSLKIEWMPLYDKKFYEYKWKK